MKKNQEIKEMFASAIKEHQKNKLKNAEKFYKKILIEDPNHFDSIFLLGTLLLQTKKFDLAKQFLQKAIHIQPNHMEGIYNLGNTLRELGELQKAINCYQKVIQINPSDSNAHYNLGEIFRDAKEFQKAANYFKKVDTILGNAQFLECIYLSNGLEHYNKLLNVFVKKDSINLRIAALAAYVSKKENIKNIYPFCGNPLDYFFSINLKDKFEISDQFSNRLLKISEKIQSNWRLKPLVKGGYQSSGNLLDNPVSEIIELKKKFEKQIVTYRDSYKDSDD